MNAIEPQRIISLNDPSDDDRITLVPLGDDCPADNALVPEGDEDAFVPSEAGEEHTVFLTSEEKNFLSRLLTVHAMGETHFDKVPCQGILRKLHGE